MKLKTLGIAILVIQASLFAGKQKVFGPEKPPPPLTFLTTKDSQNLLNFEYSLDAKPITHQSASFADLQGKSAIIFFFSATCPHCQKAIPHILKLAKDFKKDSVMVYALASKFNKEKDLANFINKYQVNIPLFQDYKAKFSRLYGTRSVPIVLLINKKGNIMRIKGFKNNYHPDKITELIRDKSKF